GEAATRLPLHRSLERRRQSLDCRRNQWLRHQLRRRKNLAAPRQRQLERPQPALDRRSERKNRETGSAADTEMIESSLLSHSLRNGGRPKPRIGPMSETAPNRV